MTQAEQPIIHLKIEPKNSAEASEVDPKDVAEAEALGPQIHNALAGEPTTATVEQVQEFLEGMHRAKTGDTDFTEE